MAITRRDIEVLSAYIDAGSMKATAARLGLHPGTIDRRMCRLHVKVGSENTAQAVYALRRELEAYRGDGPDPSDRP